MQYSVWDGLSWSASAPIPRYGTYRVPMPHDHVPAVFRNGISSDGQGNAIAVWATENYSEPIYYAIWNGPTNSWTVNATPLREQKAFGYMPAIAFNTTDDATLVYSSFPWPDQDVWCSQYDGPTGMWQIAFFAADSGGNDYRPAIAYLPNDKAMTVWYSDYAGRAPNEIFYSKWDPTTGRWSPADSIVSLGLSGDDTNPAIAAIPEFQLALILPLLMLTTLVATVHLKKKRKTKPQLP